jgi:hypothetical protein
MAFDLSKLKNPAPATHVPATAPAPTRLPPALEAQLAASVAAVAINRPADQRPARRPTVPASEALTVTSVEATAAAHAMFEIVDTVGEEAAPPAPVEETPPAPKARRGRPRKTSSPAPTSGADTVEETPTAPEPGGAPATDPKAVLTGRASGCAPSAGDLGVAVSALFQARAALSAALLSLGVES